MAGGSLARRVGAEEGEASVIGAEGSESELGMGLE